jgi:xanthine dehydrogenase YagT iron-sulfur-binding subunit
MSDDSSKTCNCINKLSRRGFLTAMGVGTVAAAGMAASAPRAEAEMLEANANTSVTLSVNGHVHRILVEPRWTLLFVLREKLGLTATKIGCERGECGSCTVLIDGLPRYACMILALEAEDVQITTLEGLMKGEELGPVQKAFVENDAFQCGYCTPGQIVAVEGLLRSNPNPNLDEIREGVSGNLCRCGAYANIFKAAAEASRLKGEGKP